MVATMKAPVNSIIEALNWIISGLNHIRVPSINVGPVHFGGLGINIPKIPPMLAEGGYADQATTAVFGEAGPEITAPEAKFKKWSMEAMQASQGPENARMESMLEQMVKLLAAMLQQQQQNASNQNFSVGLESKIYDLMQAVNVNRARGVRSQSL